MGPEFPMTVGRRAHRPIPTVLSGPDSSFMLEHQALQGRRITLLLNDAEGAIADLDVLDLAVFLVETHLGIAHREGPVLVTVVGEGHLLLVDVVVLECSVHQLTIFGVTLLDQDVMWQST